MILNSRPYVEENGQDELAAPAPLMTDMEDLQDQLEILVDKLERVGDYVKRVTVLPSLFLVCFSRNRAKKT